MNSIDIKDSTNIIKNTLKFQFDISWQLLEFHFTNIEDEECMWRPDSKGLHVYKNSGVWCADWPETEEYSIGPASIAWVTWHITYWWSMVLDHSFREGTLTREYINWPGNIIDVKKKIYEFCEEWMRILTSLSDEEFISTERTKWPFTDRPFYELAAWLNVELMKNAAEIGYCRFLYASQK